MFKIIGAIMVTAATTTVGLRSASRLKNRVKSLKSLVGGLDIMRPEICTRLTPMPELLELLSRQAGEPANLFFAECLLKLKSMRARPFAEIWKSALYTENFLELSEDEREILAELGSALGRYDTERQGDAISSARKRLEAKLAKAENEKDKEIRLRTVLGVAAGLALAIILI